MQLQSHLMHVPAKSFNARLGDQIQWKREQNQIICKKQMIDLAVSNHDTPIGLTALVYPIHVNYEMERRQNAPLPETNVHMEWL